MEEMFFRTSIYKVISKSKIYFILFFKKISPFRTLFTKNSFKLIIILGKGFLQIIKKILQFKNDFFKKNFCLGKMILQSKSFH